jgi:hypothetical protein
MSLLLNKYILYVIGILAAIAIVVATYFSWKHSIQQEALLGFNNQQLEQIIKDNKTIQSQLNVIAKDQKDVLDNEEAKNIALNNNLKGITDYLALDQIKKQNKASSDILKHVIKLLPVEK